MIKGNKRQPDESYEEYRERLAYEKDWLKANKKGQIRPESVKIDNNGRRVPYVNPLRQMKKALKRAKEKADG